MLNSLSINDISIQDCSSFFKSTQEVSVLRLDKIHPVISGNKWFKLRFYIEDAISQGKKTILSFGGAWSNHISALAETCRLCELKSIGVIRGEEPRDYSPTLTAAKQAGMQLVFLSRSDYQQQQLPTILDDDGIYRIPEGGYGELGRLGAEEITRHFSPDCTHIVCAVGTGTMMAGLIRATAEEKKIIGISVLKNHHELDQKIIDLLPVAVDASHWQLLHDHHVGGYAKHQPSLFDFMNRFYAATTIPTDFVYTGKAFMATAALLDKGFFPAKARILLVHSGGLQGNTSLSKGTLIF